MNLNVITRNNERRETIGIIDRSHLDADRALVHEGRKTERAEVTREKMNLRVCYI